jgi:hypothetical protein
MSLSLHTLLYRILLASALIAGVSCTSQTTFAKGAKPGGGAKPNFSAARPNLGGAKPIVAKPSLGTLKPISAKPKFGGAGGGSLARTKAPGSSLPPNLAKVNPNLGGVQPIKLPGLGGTMPTFPPINPGSGIPTTPPYTPPINPGSGPHPHPCHPHHHHWCGLHVNLFGWRGGCYVPPLYAPVVTCPTVVGGDTVIVNEVAAAPVIVAGTLPEVMVGTQVSLVADAAGAEQGQMILEVSGLALACRIDAWGQTVTATLPGFGLAAKTPAKLHVIRADGSVARSQEVMLIPAVAK